MKHIYIFIGTTIITCLLISLVTLYFMWHPHKALWIWLAVISLSLVLGCHFYVNLGYEKNKDLSNQFNTMVSQCQTMNAAKFKMSFRREDGYTIDVTARQTEAKFDDEFSNEELKFIKETMIEKISSVSNKEAAEKAFDIVNVCQELLGEPLFDSVDEIVISNL